MMYFLYGQDSARIKQRLNEVLSEFKNSGDFQQLNFDASQDSDYSRLNSFLNTNLLFQEQKKIAVISGLFEKENTDVLHIIQHANLDDKNLCAVAVANKGEAECKKIDPQLWRVLDKKPINKELFIPMQPKSLPAWVREMVKEKGFAITPGAINLLISRVGADAPLLLQEIDKLSCYVKSSGEIDEDAVALLAADMEQTSGFGITDAMGRKQKARTIELLYKYLSEGQDAHQLFGAFVYQARNLLSVRSMMDGGMAYSDIQEYLGVHPFVMRKSYEMAKKFTLPELKQLYQELARIEQEVKLGSAELEGALFDVLVNVG